MPVYKFAGFWRRLVAYLIDNTIICFVFFILFMIATISYFLGVASTEENQWIADLTDPEKIYDMAVSMTFFSFLFCIVIMICYFTYFHGTTGRTPGKMILGLQVVREDGKPLAFGIAFLRSVGYLVSSLLLTFPIGFIWAAFDKRKQGWHDKIAGTVVIIREEQTPAEGITIPDSSPPAQVPQNNN